MKIWLFGTLSVVALIVLMAWHHPARVIASENHDGTWRQVAHDDYSNGGSLDAMDTYYWKDTTTGVDHIIACRIFSGVSVSCVLVK